MTYTANQRNIVQCQLLGRIKGLIQNYSERQLSIRGRVTIANTLIMSTAWHQLRLLNPTRQFMQTLRSLIFNYVWQKKEISSVFCENEHTHRRHRLRLFRSRNSATIIV
ncbi:hypothetical protein BY458DRAFT_528719, partial [Sporodiniella umbellata]